jgi:hypothetical protein
MACSERSLVAAAAAAADASVALSVWCRRADTVSGDGAKSFGRSIGDKPSSGDGDGDCDGNGDADGDDNDDDSDDGKERLRGEKSDAE